MNDTRSLPRAAAAMAWAADAATHHSGGSYTAGFGDGLLLGFALAKLEPGWASAALEELLQLHQRTLAERLGGTPMPPPSVEAHRLLVFAQAQDLLRRANAGMPEGQSDRP